MKMSSFAGRGDKSMTDAQALVDKPISELYSYFRLDMRPFV